MAVGLGLVASTVATEVRSPHALVGHSRPGIDPAPLALADHINGHLRRCGHRTIS
ncbi:hypothetical protein ACWD5V_29365 [Streptomyces sp. NPDC002523]